MKDDLIGRLEAATGPDWRLDVVLANHYYPGDRDMHRAAMEGRWNPTASVDKALTLVPKGCFAEINTYENPYCFVWSDDDEGSHQGTAATPALALCIASLRAQP